MKYIYSFYDGYNWSPEETCDSVQDIQNMFREKYDHKISRDDIRAVCHYYEGMINYPTVYCPYLKVIRKTFIVKSQSVAKRIMCELMTHYPSEEEWKTFRTIWQKCIDTQ